MHFVYIFTLSGSQHVRRINPVMTDEMLLRRLKATSWGLGVRFLSIVKN